jgi:hypothetical protein
MAPRTFLSTGKATLVPGKCDLIYTCNYKKFLTERKESVQVIVIAEKRSKKFVSKWS